MEREKALRKFQERISGRLGEYRNHVVRNLLERAQELEDLAGEAAGQLGKQMKEQQKEYIGFLYGGVLKTDLLQRKYRFFFHAMDLRWYLDTESLEVYVDAQRLFQPFDEMWDALTQESHNYQGVVNVYDVRNIMFGELKYINAEIARILRWRLRDWEKKGIFRELTFSPFWLMKWGDYRDQTEFIIQTDRTVKDSAKWKEELKKARYKPEVLLFSYWYQGEYEDSRLPGRDMRFCVFEECRLKKIIFEQCNLEGSRFVNCRLSECSFDGCSLVGADFTDCEFGQVTFQGADLAGAAFPAERVPFLNLDPDQLQEIILARKEEA